MKEETFQKDIRPSGENFVWLTAMGLASGLLMVVGLLLVIVVNGVGVFWPDPVHLVELKADATSGPRQNTLFGASISEKREKLSQNAEGTYDQEYKFFVGNKETYGEMFLFVDASAIVSMERPDDIVMAERLENGDAIFYPLAIINDDGTEIPATDDGFDAALQEEIDACYDRLQEFRSLSRGPIGRLSYELKSNDISQRVLIEKYKQREGEASELSDAELNALITQLQEMDRLFERVRVGVDAAREPYQALRSQGGVFEALGQLHDQQMTLQTEVETYTAQTQALQELNEARQLRYELVTGEVLTEPIGHILRFYRPNQMGFFEKVGFFISHVWEFLTEAPREANTEGGVFPAIFGTFVMTVLMSAAVMPFGVLAAIYLREYASQGPFTQSIRIAINNLAGVPSIVYGVFGLGFFVYGVGGWIDGGAELPMQPSQWLFWGFILIGAILLTVVLAIEEIWTKVSFVDYNFRKYASSVLGLFSFFLFVWLIFKNPYFHGFFSERLLLNSPTFGTGGVLWASLTLALMTVPVVVVATEEALAAVPRGMREASLACGASKWQTIQRVVLPASASGILTGLILAMARGAGEVAPLMVVGVIKFAPDLPIDFTPPFFHFERKFMHLGFHIYDLGFQSPDAEAAKPMVFATTLLLIILVVMLNLGAILIRDHLRKKYSSGTF